MEMAYVSAFAALGGSVVGGLTSGIATWVAQRSEIRAGRRAHQLSRREDLFQDFLCDASKAYGQAMMSNQPDLQELISLYGMINRMQVLCLPRTIACAERVVQETVETYFQANKTAQDISTLVKEGSGINPLSKFAEAAREELRTFASR